MIMIKIIGYRRTQYFFCKVKLIGFNNTQITDNFPLVKEKVSGLSSLRKL